jgi:predicted DNA-binding antitoxin AbrB/MazE fold protein
MECATCRFDIALDAKLAKNAVDHCTLLHARIFPPKGSVTIIAVRLVEAEYENGVLRPVEQLALRPGERVSLMVLRRADPSRWNLARLSSISHEEDLELSEEGIDEWANSLDSAELG